MEKNVTQNNKKRNKTMDLYSMLGQSKSTSTKKTSGNSSIQSTIKKRLYEVCEDTLRKEFSEHFYNLDDTQVIKKSIKDGVDDEVQVLSGKCLVFPIDNEVEIKRGDNKHVFKNAVGISKLQIYCGGANTQVAEYVKIGQQTQTWNGKKFSQVKAK